MKKNLLVAFSGGETSGFMAQWLLAHKSDEYNMIFTFANTGQENEETLIFADKCDKHFGLNLVWLECVVNPEMGEGTEHKIVDFGSAYRWEKKNGTSPFRETIKKYGIPDKESPVCTREMKRRAMESYARGLGWARKDYESALGIRIDEVDRMSSSKEEERLIYPLISMQRMNKQMINWYWKNMPFRLNLRGWEGNCAVCFKKALRKLLTIAKHHPERFDFPIAMEAEFEQFVPDTRKDNENIKLPIRFYRDNLSAHDILEMAKHPFEEAMDDSKNYYIQREMFGHDLDSANGCEESCEPY